MADVSVHVHSRVHVHCLCGDYVLYTYICVCMKSVVEFECWRSHVTTYMYMVRLVIRLYA